MQQFKKLAPQGRAIFKAAHFHPSEEMPDEEYPFALSTGRRVYRTYNRLSRCGSARIESSLNQLDFAASKDFHTRTKTGRSQKLHEAMPETFIQISDDDAARLGIKDGEFVVARSRHGQAQMKAKVGDIEVGQVFSKLV